jgi:hypothetical protein
LYFITYNGHEKSFRLESYATNYSSAHLRIDQLGMCRWYVGMHRPWTLYPFLPQILRSRFHSPVYFFVSCLDESMRAMNVPAVTATSVRRWVSGNAHFHGIFYNFGADFFKRLQATTCCRPKLRVALASAVLAVEPSICLDMTLPH